MTASDLVIISRTEYETLLFLFGMSVAANAIGIVIVILMTNIIRSKDK